MLENEVLLRVTLSEAEANRVVVVLASMGIESALDADERGGVGIYVSDTDVDAATRVLLDDPPLEPGASECVPDGPGLVAPRAWFGRGAATVLAMMAACVAVFVLSVRGEDAGTRSRLLDLGAIDYARVNAGEYWRFVTAIFLHFDIGHLLANLSVLIILGPPLAHQIGPWLFMLVFLTSGVGANVVSHLLAPVVGLKAGASGAIAGVLGALAGLALQPSRRTRRKSWQTLGALAAMYGFLIGFGPGRDNTAHVAGLLVGVALGRWSVPANRGAASDR